MRPLREFVSRLFGVRHNLTPRGGAADDDLRAEMEAHLEMQVAENMRRGMSADDARRHALLQAGGFTTAVESVRRQRGFAPLEAVFNDVRLAARTLIAQRGFSVAVLLTLGMGIAATVAMFSILNAVILRPLPFPEPERIVSLSASKDGSDMGQVDDRSFEDWQRSARSVEAMTVYTSASAAMATRSGPQSVRGTIATAPYFSVMGVRPVMGRTFTPEEDRPGGPVVVLLGEELWRTSFGADSSIVGTTVVVDGVPSTVIGIMPAWFATATRSQFWRPYRLRPSREGMTYYYQVRARLGPDASIETLRAELAAIQQRFAPGRPKEFRDMTPVVMTMHERRYGDARQTLVLLFAAVGVLLLITCANIANLSLARAVRRQREFALRLALGAGRWRIVRYVLTESLMLAVGGAVLGLMLAASSIGYFVRMSPRSVANADRVGVDTTVMLFTLGLTVLVTLLFGLLPALTAARSNVNVALAGASARTTGSRRQRNTRRSLVVLELATALVLVVGAGLVARTFWNVVSTPRGFEPGRVLTATMDLPGRIYDDTTGHAFMETLLQRVREMPSVASASVSDALPLTGARMSVAPKINGKSGPRFEVVGVTPGYFATIGTRIVEGRAIGTEDREHGVRTVVLSAALAHALFPGRSAVGEQIIVTDSILSTVVGVSEDVRQRGLEGEASKVAFVPLVQYGGWTYTQLAVRTRDNSAALQTAITRSIASLDPTLPAPQFKSMDDIVGETVAPRKFVFVLLTIFAALAGLLAVIGLYGVLSYLVSEQSREIGIRIALGANRSNVLRFVLGEGMTLTAIGIAGGLVAAFMGSELMEKLVYGTSVRDGATFAGGALLLATVALLASWLPARRASQTDPMSALRAE